MFYLLCFLFISYCKKINYFSFIHSADGYQHYTNSIENFFSQLKHYLKLNEPSSTFSQLTCNNIQPI